MRVCCRVVGVQCKHGRSGPRSTERAPPAVVVLVILGGGERQNGAPAVYDGRRGEALQLAQPLLLLLQRAGVQRRLRMRPVVRRVLATGKRTRQRQLRRGIAREG